ncbi:MAG: hypothetical protein NZP34_06780, partial [Caldilineales bacterium]|nr:hypothetical protein [Caldilineales bacterium]
MSRVALKGIRYLHWALTGSGTDLMTWRIGYELNDARIIKQHTLARMQRFRPMTMMAQVPTGFHPRRMKDAAQAGILLYVSRPSSWRAADSGKG